MASYTSKKQSSLNNQQLQMLKIFKTPMSKEDFIEVKRFIVRILAKNIDTEMTILEEENNWNADTYEQWGKEHLRTPYHK